MVAYKKSSSSETEWTFQNLKAGNFPNPISKNWPSLIFLPVTPFLQLLTGLFYSTLSDPQDADADSDAPDTDCHIDIASKCKTLAIFHAREIG